MKTVWIAGVETPVSDLAFAAIFPVLPSSAVYQQINLSDTSAVGTPGPLPVQLLGLSDAQLANLDAVSDPLLSGFAGQGFWLVVFTTPPYDATAQAPTGTATVGTPDPKTNTVPATENLRALTAAEIAAALASAQTAKLAELSDACAAQILAGYSSSALGSAHTYPAKQQDQDNMTASVVDSIVPGLPDGWTTPFWCADVTGTWGFAPHTAAQIQQAGRDGKAAIVAAQAKLAGLKAQVGTAGTAAAVTALAW